MPALSCRTWSPEFVMPDLIRHRWPSLSFGVSRQALPGVGSCCDGLPSRLSPLHSDFAVKIGLAPASQNSLRA
jgi:hypothetical protein